MKKDTLILEQITDKNTKLVKSEIVLYANDDDLNYFDIHLGGDYFGSKQELGDNYYHHYFNISDELQAILIDNYLENKDGLRWFSRIHVQFKP